MIAGIYRGVNGHIRHPLSKYFLPSPRFCDWYGLNGGLDDAERTDKIREFADAARDPNRRYPLDSYAVFDDEEQVIDRWSILAEDENFYILSLYTVRKDEQPEYGGWRWHKWGEYLGDREPQCEYLYDEPEIDEVVVVAVHEIDTSTKFARDETVDWAVRHIGKDFVGS